MGMNAAILLLTALASTLVLRSGERIEVDGAVRHENGRAIFRSTTGTLYSVASSEISEEVAPLKPTASTQKQRKPVSEVERARLLQELEKNHSGKPAPVSRVFEVPPPPPTRDEERDWRQRARAHAEAVQRAEEALELLRLRAERLQGEIRGLLSLGYSPRQFTYQTTRLHRVLEAIPYAELDVTRARRANEQFREDARREGVLPGWLR
jgi:hypothetical protein